MIEFLKIIIPELQNYNNIIERESVIDSYSGWRQEKEYIAHKISAPTYLIKIRHAFGDEIFIQRLVDFEYEEIHFTDTSSFSINIFYLLDRKMSSADNILIFPLHKNMILSNNIIEINHYYIPFNFIEDKHTQIINQQLKCFTTKVINNNPINKPIKSSGGLRTKGISKKSSFEKPLITIITSVRNENILVEQTIQSVINQTYDNIEYIVIDACSTDGTLETINKYEDFIDYFISEQDQGTYFGMQKGIELSTGDYILILNSNDYYVNNRIIKSVVDHINKYPNIDFFFADVFYLLQNKTISLYTARIENILKGNSIPHPTLVIKKQVFLKYGGLDLKFRIAADFDFIIRMIINNLTYMKMSITMVYFRKGGTCIFK